MREVFLSYSRADAEFVRKLSAGLRDGGYDVFYDEDLTGGQRWWDTLLDHVEQCDGFIPILSESYVESEPCRREASYAVALGKTMLPVTTGSSQIPGRLLLAEIAEAQWVSYDPLKPDTIWALVRALNRLPAPRPMPEPLPRRPEVPISYLVEFDQMIDSQQEMTAAEQHDLVDRLISSAGRGDPGDVRRLLQRLRMRPDIRAVVAERIEAFLASRLSSTSENTFEAAPVPDGGEARSTRGVDRIPDPPPHAGKQLLIEDARARGRPLTLWEPVRPQEPGPGAMHFNDAWWAWLWWNESAEAWYRYDAHEDSWFPL
jgi:TIR domain